MTDIKRVLVTGGAGYVGSALVPRLLAEGYRVRVLDLYLFGDHVFDEVKPHPSLEEVKGDIRDRAVVGRAVAGCDAVIHLACISNDPSFELNPALGRAINYDAFLPLVQLSRDAGVGRFVYASTSSVYGVSDAPDVTENHPLEPLTDYSKYKALCEPALIEHDSPDFTTVIVRPATVCGWSPRQRLDLTVNILTTHAICSGRITVFGGDQMRANIHIADMVDLYLLLLALPASKISGKIFNVGCENHTVAAIGSKVRDMVQRELPDRGPIELVRTPSDDRRSYHISSEKIRRELGFVATRTIEDAVCDLAAAFRAGRLPNALTHPRYYNIKTMQQVQLA